MISLRQLAKSQGVSVATVSKALRDNPEVKPSTREAIKEAARRHGYFSNHLVQGVFKGRTPLIAIIQRQVGATDQARMLTAVTDRFLEAGYASIVLGTRSDLAREEKCFEAAIGFRVSGVVLATIDYGEEVEHYRHLVENRVPCVVTSEFAPESVVSKVHTNDEQVVSEVIDRLWDWGHRKIGFVGLKADTLPTRRRFQGYIDGLRQHGIEPQESWIATTPGMPDAMVEAADRLLEAHPDITAIFGATDRFAAAVIKAGRRRGRRIGEDLSVFGMGNLPMGNLLDPELTTISHNENMFAEALTSLLLDSIRTQRAHPHKPLPTEDRVVPGEVIWRRSTGPLH